MIAPVRFQRSARPRRAAPLPPDAAFALVQRARRVARAAPALATNAAAEAMLLRRCATAFARAARTLAAVPYSDACPRHQLCNTYIAIGKCFERQDDVRAAAAEYRRALLAAPYSVTARYELALSIRDDADSQSDLHECERWLRGAIEAHRALEQQLLVQRVFTRTRAIELEACAAAAAESALAFLLAQEDRPAEASACMRRMGFQFQLAHNVLHYALDSGAGVQTDVAAARLAAKYAAIVDDAMPPSMCAHLLRVFGPTSPFWREHDYFNPACGYFSYLHPLAGADLGSTTLDAVIHHVHRLVCQQFPGAKEARYAEWWSHCRRHAKGHQFHYDSDNEGDTREGEVPRHPIVSVVVYLTLAGGPTLITNQYLSSKRLATHGWLIHPRRNRVAMFDGGVLHGVLPGRSFCAPPPSPLAGANNVIRADAPDELQRAPDGGARRTTFMIAFWKDIVSAQRRADGRPGAAIPFPGSPLARRSDAAVDFARSHTWPSLVRDQHALLAAWQRLPHDATMVSDASSTAACDGIGARGGASNSGRPGGGDHDTNRPRLSLPMPVERVFDAVGGEARGRALMQCEMPPYNKCFQGF